MTRARSISLERSILLRALSTPLGCEVSRNEVKIGRQSEAQMIAEAEIEAAARRLGLLQDYRQAQEHPEVAEDAEMDRRALEWLKKRGLR